MKGIFRYLISILQTLLIIFKTKPDIIFVQNPSMILATVVCLCKIFIKFFLVVDRHTTFLLNKKELSLLKVFIFKLLHSFTIKYADITIVTNSFLADLVTELKGNPYVLPDMIPDLSSTQKKNLKGRFNILLISSFGSDEPISEVLDAIRSVNINNVIIYITGNTNKLDKTIVQTAPPNVIFTGFLEEQDYINMLFSVDAIMVLTTSDACMLCGCYEAISACKPLITSNKDVLREYFTEAVFVDNTSSGISGGIKKVIENRAYYQDRIKELKEKIIPEWEKQYDNLEKKIIELNKINVRKINK